MQELHINPNSKNCLKRYSPIPSAKNNFCLKYCNHSNHCLPKQKSWLSDEFLNWQIKNSDLKKHDWDNQVFKIPKNQHIIMFESLNGEKFN